MKTPEQITADFPTDYELACMEQAGIDISDPMVFIPEDSVVLWRNARHDGKLVIYMPPVFKLNPVAGIYKEESPPTVFFCLVSYDILWGGFFEMKSNSSIDAIINDVVNYIDTEYPKYVLDMELKNGSFVPELRI